MKMLNEFILCTKDKTASTGFEISKSKFENLIVEHTYDEKLLPKGSKIKVSSNAGEVVEEDKLYRLIQRKDVIYIL